MSTLIMEIKANRMMHRALFDPSLKIYDDLLVYRTRGIIRINEVTVSYNHIAQVNLKKGLIWGTLEIVSGGSERVLIKYLPRKDAALAKRTIDQKIYHAHSVEKLHDNQPSASMHNLEKSLSRYKELVAKGKMTQKEFEKKRQELVKKL